jgi:hypothetical protein
VKEFYLLIALLIASQLPSPGQDNSAALPSTYDRSSLTLILIDRYESKVRDLFTKVVVPGKYFENKIDEKSIGVSQVAGANGLDVNSIAGALNRGKIGNKIISYWYARQADGTMSADRFLERGMYNATDADILKAKGTKRGVEAIKDYGEKLISKSYAVVLDYSPLREINEGNDRGWASDVKLYLFKVNFDDATQAKLYNELWIYNDDSPEVKAKKKLAFDKMNFYLESVSQVSGSAIAQELKNPPPNYRATLTNDQLLEVVLQDGLEKCLDKLENNVEDIKVKTSIYQTNPPRAKIGEKEGLKVDQLYFAYEYVYKEKTNSTKAVRRSILRAKNVVNNLNVARGSSDMSTFYRITAGHLHTGFTLQQHNELGIGVYIGKEFGNMGGISARIEKRTGGIPAMYIFIEGSMQNKMYDRMPDKQNNLITDQRVYFIRGDLGVAKGIRLIRILELAPYLSIGYEAAKSNEWKNNAQFNGDILGSLYFKYGANLSLNLSYNFQLVGGIGGYLFLNAEDGKGEIVIEEQKATYDHFFPDRSWGDAFSKYVGIRFQF